MIRAFLFLALGCVALLAAPGADASRGGADDANICDAAAEIAARSGVPVNIMRAVTRTETGRAINGQLTPWPWTVNMEGAGHWFDTREEALAFVKKNMKRGARSFDVGCFQINYRWHGDAFESVEAMFDPAGNARYAAKFLKDLKRETGDWRGAVGRYHSKTPKFASRYKKRFDRILAKLDDAAPDRTLVATLLTASDDTGGARGGSAVLLASAAVEIGGPRHPGGVALSGLSNGRGLLRQARPLF